MYVERKKFSSQKNKKNYKQTSIKKLYIIETLKKTRFLDKNHICDKKISIISSYLHSNNNFKEKKQK